MFSSTLFFVFAAHHRTLHDWVYSVLAVMGVALFMVLERRDELRKKREHDDAIDVVNRLERDGKGLGDATRTELEKIRIALK
jgi:hypothetical protein